MKRDMILAIGVQMEVIPNTWENADRLCEILKCDRGELSKRVPMENEE